MNTKAILLVEDNPDREAVMLRALRQNNISNDVIVARDGAEAIDYLLSNSYVPLALVLLDVKVPRVEGLKVLRSVRAAPHTRRLPVVILTTSKEEQNRAGGRRLSPNPGIRKPVDFAQFTKVACQVGLYWQALNEATVTSPELI